MAPTPDWVNVLDYDTVQLAIDAAAARPTGALVYAPAGDYTPLGIGSPPKAMFIPPLLFPSTKPLRLVGDGPEVTRFRSTAPGPDNTHLVHVRGDYQSVENLTLEGSGQASGTGVGIRIWRAEGTANLIYRTLVSNVRITKTPGWGIMVDDAIRNGVSQFSVWAIYDNVEITNVGGSASSGYGGMYFGTGGTTTQYVHNARIRDFYGIGLKARFADGIAFEDSAIEKLGTAYDTDKNFIECEGCSSLAVRHSRFEGRNLKSIPYIRMFGEYMGTLIDVCAFYQRADAVDVNDLKAIRLQGTNRGTMIGSIMIRIPGNAAAGEGEHIRIFGAPSTGVEPEVSIGPCGVDDVTSGAPVPRFRINSDSKLATLHGVALRHRILRITAAERDSLSDLKAGDLIYNIDLNKAQMYDGSFWKDLW